jgi:hypothetical protein
MFLQNCFYFINKFVGPGWFERISRNGNYAEQFQLLHQVLNQYSQNLNLELSTTQYFFSLTKNDIAAQNDLEEIDEILSSVKKNH